MRLLNVLFTATFFSCFISIVNAQQIRLEGVVTIHNSKYNTGKTKYVSNTQIFAEFTNPASSDDKGNFELIFVGIEEGTSIKIHAEKSGLEIVNKRELSDVVVGRRIPLKIYLAPIGELAKAQTELYNVSIASLTKRHNKIIAQLRGEAKNSNAAIKDLEQKINRAISDRFEAEQILTEQLNTTKQRLPEFAKELAIVNLDYASKMYQEAYEYFKNGEIEKAIETLDEAILDREAKEALERLSTLKNDISTLDSAKVIAEKDLCENIKSLILKAKAHYQKLQYDSTIINYNLAINFLHEREGNCQYNLSEIYYGLSEVYEKNKTTKKAIKYKLKYLEFLEKKKAQDFSKLIVTYKEISHLYALVDNPEKEIVFYRKAYVNLKTIYPKDEIILKTTENDFLFLLEIRGKKLQAENQYSKAIKVYKEILTITPHNKTVKRFVRKLKRKRKRKSK